MRLFLAVLVALTPVGALAQADGDGDEAHRADRAQTQDLNRSVQRSVAQRDAANAAKLSRYRDAAAEYERKRADWRKRFVACQNGDSRACSPY